MNDVVWFSEKILGKLVSLKERPPNPTPKKENGENDQLKDEKNQPSVSLTVTDFSKAFGIRIDEGNGEVYLVSVYITSQH
ncbi:MAG: hypothetical protein EOO88_10070 [Pedobacter sp.]|nr:MAG: hypothetical protein EOO88_10070 [Pedobacter sp.]